jgi:hypothetical protein
MQAHLVLKPTTNLGGTVSNTTTTLASFGVVPTDAVGCILTVETAAVRFTWDGTVPTASVGGGVPMAKDSVWEIVGRDLMTNIKMIAQGSDAYVSVALYKAE